MDNGYQIAAASVSGSAKTRNGDAQVFFSCGSDQRYLCAMVADGVGSTSSDWLASSTACAHFQSFVVDAAGGGPPERWLPEALEQIDGELNGHPKLLLCAAVAVCWEVGGDCLHYSNIGDTRLHKVGIGGLEQVSEDQSRAVARRGSDGKPLRSGGAVVIQRGITQALGNGQIQAKVETCRFEPGDACILSSDGFHGETALFRLFTKEVVRSMELKTAVDAAIRDCGNASDDDATVLALRREGDSVKEASIERIVQEGSWDNTVAPHVIFTEIEKRLNRWVENQDQARFLRDLQFLSENHCLLPKTRLEALKSSMLDAGWDLNRQHAPLDRMLRQHLEQDFIG